MFSFSLQIATGKHYSYEKHTPREAAELLEVVFSVVVGHLAASPKLIPSACDLLSLRPSITSPNKQSSLVNKLLAAHLVLLPPGRYQSISGNRENR